MKTSLRVATLFLVLTLLFCTVFTNAQESALIQQAPLNPAFILYQQQLQMKGLLFQTTEKGYFMGLVPSPLNWPRPVGARIFEPSRAALPASYDLRTLGRVTSVKDQGTSPSCWAHTACASAESCLLPGETWDFSENHLKNTNGFDWGPNGGGNTVMATAYFARWAGPVSEADDPYNPASTTSPTGLKPKKHIQDVIAIPPRANALDNNNIKQALMDYGAIATDIFYHESYYNSATHAYCYQGGDVSEFNHEVTIVGWDDSFDKSKFTPAAPGNGAFIVKNSWGTTWGDKGYGYISYYDKYIGKIQNAVFLKGQATSNYAHNYQYDPLGDTTNIGYSKEDAWFANVFTATATENLSAVGFYVPQVNSTYEIKIYTGVTGDPITGTLAGTKTGTMAAPGYRTIPLSIPVYITKGKKFAVVVHLTTPGYIYPIPLETPIPNYSSTAKASAGQSYMSHDGADWDDATYFPDTNVCLKAFTKVIRPNDAVFVSNTIPSKMVAGQSYTVKITVKNIGSNPWTTATNYQLGAVGGSDPFATISQPLAAGETVAANQTKTFTLTMKAPATPGSYTTDWRMQQTGTGWFGSILTKTVTVARNYDSKIVSNTIPAAMEPGQQYSVKIAVKNAGLQSWTAANNCKLGAWGSSDPFATTWHLLNATDNILFNQTKTFDLTMTAPTTPGVYTTDWRMYRTGTGWFGATLTKTVIVAKPNDAEIVSHNIPSAMQAGQTYTVNITMRNTGTNPWTAANGYKLAAVGGSDPFASVQQSLASTESIAYSQTKTFTLTMKAPATAGTYKTDWQMQYGTAAFGAIVTKSVVVSSGSGISVSVDPSEVWLPPGGMKFFKATVTGTNNQTVNWTVQPASTGGTISSNGFYTAPTTLGNYYVVATSAADTTKKAKALVHVVAGDYMRKYTGTITVTRKGTRTSDGAIIDEAVTLDDFKVIEAGDGYWNTKYSKGNANIHNLLGSDHKTTETFNGSFTNENGWITLVIKQDQGFYNLGIGIMVPGVTVQAPGSTPITINYPIAVPVLSSLSLPADISRITGSKQMTGSDGVPITIEWDLKRNI